MFTRWLLTVFPQDLRIGWRLLRANLTLWIILAALAALVGPVAARMAASGSHENLIALGTLTWAIGLTQAIVSIPLFDDAYRRRRTDWTRARGLLPRRALPFVLAATIIVPGSLGAAAVAMAAVRAILQTTPVAEFAVPLAGIIIYISLLVRFCYVPFLIVLHTRNSLPEGWVGGSKLLHPFLVLLWPFLASSRMSEGHRWRLVPYVGLLYVIRLLQTRVPADLRIFSTLATVMVALTAQAILFRYFAERVDPAA